MWKQEELYYQGSEKEDCLCFLMDKKQLFSHDVAHFILMELLFKMGNIYLEPVILNIFASMGVYNNSTNHALELIYFDSNTQLSSKMFAVFSLFQLSAIALRNSRHKFDCFANVFMYFVTSL